jgi:hypothetical protein
MKKLLIFIFLIIFAMVFTVAQQASWEGNVIVGTYGEFPPDGLYAASDAFERNTLVTVENPRTGEKATVLVVKRLNTPGLFMVLSPEAATELGIPSGQVVPIKVIPGAQESSNELFTEDSQSSDPDAGPSGQSSDELGFLQSILQNTEQTAEEPEQEDRIDEILTQEDAEEEPVETVQVEDEREVNEEVVVTEEIVTTDPVEEEPEQGEESTGEELAETPVEEEPVVEQPEVTQEGSSPYNIISRTADPGAENLPGDLSRSPSIPEEEQQEKPRALSRYIAPGKEILPDALYNSPLLAIREDDYDEDALAVELPPVALSLPVLIPPREQFTFLQNELPSIPGSFSPQRINQGYLAAEQEIIPEIASLDEPPQPMDDRPRPVVGSRLAGGEELGDTVVLNPQVPDDERPDVSTSEQQVPEEEDFEVIITDPEIPSEDNNRADEPGDVATEEPVEIEVTLSPTDSQPPPKKEPDAVGKVESPVVQRPVVSEAVYANISTELKSGNDYIQLGVYSQKSGAETLVTSLAERYPMVMQESGPRFRVLVGPLTRDESGAVLMLFRNRGFEDAFIRQAF